MARAAMIAYSRTLFFRFFAIKLSSSRRASSVAFRISHTSLFPLDGREPWPANDMLLSSLRFLACVSVNGGNREI